MDYEFGYCTNVHAGVTLEEAKSNLLRVAAPVRDRLTPDGRLPVGLWLPEKAADGLLKPGELFAFRDWLASERFIPYTINGFPQGDFHQEIVKHAVYEPTWACESRSRYTETLCELLEAMLPDGAVGSISTLPLGWPHAPWHADSYAEAADYLHDVARYLDRLAQKRGIEIVLAIEPEPGCVLDTASDMVEFFEHFLFQGPDAMLARRHLGVCHDICHSGVMFESQRDALDAYQTAGIRIGKVQVSSAIHVPWDRLSSDPSLAAEMLTQVRSFSEPRYLHQTTRRHADGLHLEMVDDLSLALQRWGGGNGDVTPWRIHYHVPIFAGNIGVLETTRDQIHEACMVLEANQDKVAGRPWFTGHYEVETYAWNVLPEQIAAPELGRGIAEELMWFRSTLDIVRSGLSQRLESERESEMRI